MGLGSAFGDAFVEGGVEVGLFQHGIYYVDGCVAVLIVLGIAVTPLLLHESGVLDALLSQAELEHLDAANQVLVDVLLR